MSCMEQFVVQHMIKQLKTFLLYKTVMLKNHYIFGNFLCESAARSRVHPPTSNLN